MLPEALFRRWIHSREEDTPGVTVYRPEGHPLPPARGRRALELRRDGSAVRYDIGRGDGWAAVPARWREVGPLRIVVEREDRPDAPESLAILSCEPDLLRVRS